jgi:hypothetical protein
MPAPAEAESIVANLWSQHEDAVGAFEVSGLPTFETGAAAAFDDHLIQYVLCGCADQIGRHPFQHIVPLVPRGGEGDSFLAQVQTRNVVTRNLVWYIVGVKRDQAGTWKMGFYTFAGYGKRRHLRVPVDAQGYAPAVTGETVRHLERLAASNVERTRRRAHLHVRRTNYGADVTTDFSVRTASDGIYGFELPSGRTVVCYTLHEADSYSSDGGLFQDGERKNWGPLLAPGDYHTIVIDSATSLCDLDRDRLAQHLPQHVSVTGTA